MKAAGGGAPRVTAVPGPDPIPLFCGNDRLTNPGLWP